MHVRGRRVRLEYLPQRGWHRRLGVGKQYKSISTYDRRRSVVVLPIRGYFAPRVRQYEEGTPPFMEVQSKADPPRPPARGTSVNPSPLDFKLQPPAFQSGAGSFLV